MTQIFFWLTYFPVILVLPKKIPVLKHTLGVLLEGCVIHDLILVFFKHITYQWLLKEVCPNAFLG